MGSTLVYAKLVAAACWLALSSLNCFASSQELGTLTPGCSYFAMEHTTITFLTPYVATQPGNVTAWRANFAPMMVPAAIQLKIFRQVSPGQMQVVGVGELHDARSAIDAIPGYPSFDSDASIVEFAEGGLKMLTGDILGVTLIPDPDVGGFYYTLVAGMGSHAVQQDVVSGGAIDLHDSATSVLPEHVPAILVTVALDIVVPKPGSPLNGRGSPGRPLGGFRNAGRAHGQRTP